MKKYIQPSLATESVNAVILAASGPTANDAGNPGIGNGGPNGSDIGSPSIDLKEYSIWYSN